ncbi:MAG: PhnD/SsuA/transferrin family substrate-binding protein, partial [Lentisphaerae bacterium]|nr:PhnD/SsuA/transferrin family substrate-binding protein [Lentisphaerota bacterium]
QVGRTPAFVLHGSYAETRRELEGRRLDVALVCTGTYVLCTDHVVLLAQPEFADGLLYRSVVLVPRSSPAHSFTDLEGTVMGFTDPESNTGCLVPTDLILNQKTTPERFFRKVVFTGSHDRSIRAAALGIVDAVAVDSLVWCPTAAQAPRLADRLRVLWESPSFGPPPIVAPATIDQALKHALQETLLHLHETAEGSRVLRELGIIRFVAPRPEDYRSASELAARVRQR